jgi:hypothetical protein
MTSEDLEEVTESVFDKEKWTTCSLKKPGKANYCQMLLLGQDHTNACPVIFLLHISSSLVRLVCTKCR